MAPESHPFPAPGPVGAAPWTVCWSAAAGRAMARLPLKIVEAVAAFVDGPLACDPHRLTKRLGPPFEGKRSALRGAYRVLIELDEETRSIRVFDVVHRADAYRPR